MSDAADRYRRLAARLTTVVDAVPRSRWSASTPCEDWTALDIVKHVVETEHELYGRMGFAGQPALDSDDPVGSWSAVRDAMQQAMDDPARCDHAYDGYFGPTTFGTTVDQFYAFDLLVHAWDLARAAGLMQLEAMEPSDVTWARNALPVGEEMMRQPGLFGPAVDVPSDASEQDRFLAWTGRRP